MKTVLLVVFSVFIFSDQIFSQNIVSRKNNFLPYRDLITKGQKEEILFNLQKNKEVRVEQTNQDYQVFKNGYIYATIGKYPKYSSLMMGSSKETISLFEVRCLEDRQEFFGVDLVLKDIEGQYRRRIRVEN
ncbi:MAG: hypothetical protein AAB913_01720 [Patescibacteria group bacterium]